MAWVVTILSDDHRGGICALTLFVSLALRLLFLLALLPLFANFFELCLIRQSPFSTGRYGQAESDADISYLQGFASDRATAW